MGLYTKVAILFFDAITDKVHPEGKTGYNNSQQLLWWSLNRMPTKIILKEAIFKYTLLSIC